MPETIFQVVSRAAAESGAVFARDFIDLSERTFYEACRGADDGDEPHPENRTRTASCDSDGDAGNIADADTRCRADTEGLKRGDLIAGGLFAGTLCDERKHFCKIADLYAACADGKVEPGTHQKNDDHRGPEKSIDF